MFSFGDYSKLFYLIILIPLMIILGYLRYSSIRKKLLCLSRYKERFFDSLGILFSTPRYIISKVFLILAVVFILVAIAKPRIGYEWKEKKTYGADIVVVLDLSKSMYVADVPPSRLEVAKRKIKDLLDLVHGDRIGVVVFSGSSFVLCPLTQDYSVVDLFLESIDYGTMLVPGTSLNEALLSAISSLVDSSYDGSLSKSIILLSDGEDHGEGLDKVLESANQNSIMIHSIGIGTSQGGPIPIETGGFVKDKSGRIVISKLNPKILEKISDQTGGIYQSLSTDSYEMARIYQAGILKQDKIQQTNTETRQVQGVIKEKVWNERYGVFVGVALLLLLMSFFIQRLVYSDVKKERTDSR